MELISMSGWFKEARAADKTAKYMPWEKTVGRTCLSGVATASLTELALRSSITRFFHLPFSFCLLTTPRGGSRDRTTHKRFGRRPTLEEKTKSLVEVTLYHIMTRGLVKDPRVAKGPVVRNRILGKNRRGEKRSRRRKKREDAAS